MRRSAALVVFALASSAGSGALADEPLPLPAAYEVKSPDGKFVARTVPGAATTITARGSDTPLWSLPGWYRSMFLSPDGKTLVTCYDGLNLLGRDDRRVETVMATFHHADGSRRNVTLGDLFLLLGSMPKTVSHYRWGQCIGFDKAGRFEIDTVEKRRLYYDGEGKRVDSRFDWKLSP